MRLKDRDRTLFTEREWKLLQSSTPPHLTTLRSSALKVRIKRIRTLAEKYTDQSRRHHRSLKARTTKTDGRSLAASTAEHKANVLAEAGRRLERQLVRLSGHPSTMHSKRRLGNPPVAHSSGERTQSEENRRKQQRRQAAAESTRALTSRHVQKRNIKAVQGHTKARTRRFQGRRDAR
ncbi:MAG: hypothetical protein AB7L09_04315 [Nitrospira sp.]